MSIAKVHDFEKKLKQYNIRSGGLWYVKYLGGFYHRTAIYPGIEALIIDDNTKSLCFFSCEKEETQPDIPEVIIWIPLDRIESASVETKESLSVAKLLLAGIVAFALKNKEKFFKLSFKNDIDEIENAIFVSNNADVIAQTIMQSRYEAIKQAQVISAPITSSIRITAFKKGTGDIS